MNCMPCELHRWAVLWSKAAPAGWPPRRVPDQQAACAMVLGGQKSKQLGVRQYAWCGSPYLKQPPSLPLAGALSFQEIRIQPHHPDHPGAPVPTILNKQSHLRIGIQIDGLSYYSSAFSIKTITAHSNLRILGPYPYWPYQQYLPQIIDAAI